MVHRLVKDSKRKPEKLREKKDREQKEERSKKLVSETTERLLEYSVPIVKAITIQSIVKRDHDHDISIGKVRKILKKDMGLSYRRAKPIAIQCNSERCLVLRQQFARNLIDLLHDKWNIINVDESWLNETNFTRMIWSSPTGPATYTSKSVAPRLSLIAALDTEGNVHYSLTQANTDSDIMMLFLRHLERQLDSERPGWRDNTVLLMDGAKYHLSEEMKVYFRKMDLKVIFTGPYSFTAAPIEMLFSALKRGEINPERLPTGKR